MMGFDKIKCRAARTGFVFEVGTKQALGSFDAYKTKFSTYSIHAEADALDVRYANPEFGSLRVKYSDCPWPARTEKLTRSRPHGKMMKGDILLKRR